MHVEGNKRFIVDKEVGVVGHRHKMNESNAKCERRGVGPELFNNNGLFNANNNETNKKWAWACYYFIIINPDTSSSKRGIYL